MQFHFFINFFLVSLSPLCVAAISPCLISLFSVCVCVFCLSHSLNASPSLSPYPSLSIYLSLSDVSLFAFPFIICCILLTQCLLSLVCFCTCPSLSLHVSLASASLWLLSLILLHLLSIYLSSYMPIYLLTSLHMIIVMPNSGICCYMSLSITSKLPQQKPCCVLAGRSLSTPLVVSTTVSFGTL